MGSDGSAKQGLPPAATRLQRALSSSSTPPAWPAPPSQVHLRLLAEAQMPAQDVAPLVKACKIDAAQ